MRIIVGLGNPGKKFENTRHNTGFLVIEELKSQITKSKHQITNKSQAPNFKFQKKFNAEILCEEEILLVKPQTFMNESGKTVGKIVRDSISASWRIQNDKELSYKNLYIIHDDLDIPLGEYKMQFGRGAAGHKGVESIISHLKTKDFWRVRIGINNKVLDSKSFRVLGEDYVLGKFGKEEREIVDGVIEKVIEELLSSYL